MYPGDNDIIAGHTDKQAEKSSLKNLLTLEEWSSYFNSLSRATGLDLSVIDQHGNLILSSGKNRSCEIIKSIAQAGLSTGQAGTECPSSCSSFIHHSLTLNEPVVNKCRLKIPNFYVPVNYLGEKAVIIGRKGFASYEDFLEFLGFIKEHGVKEIPVSIPLDFVDEDQLKDLAKYVFRSTNYILTAIGEKNILIDKIGRLSTLVDNGILEGLSKNSSFINRYIVDTIGFILGSASIAILSLDYKTSKYKTVCSTGKYKNALMDVELASDSALVQEIRTAREFPFETETKKIMPSHGVEPAAGTNGDMKPIFIFPLFISGKMEGLIGVLNGKLAQEDRQLINALCDYVEATLENQSLRLAIDGKMDGVLTSISDLSHSIAPELNREKLLQTILEKSSNIIRAEQGSLMLLDRETSELLVEAKKSMDDILKKEDMSCRMGEGISGKVLESGVPMLVEDVETDPRVFLKNKPRYKTKSFMSIPIKIEDRVEGVLNVSDKTDGEAFSQNDFKLIQSFTANAAVAIERSILYKRMEELKQLTFTDPLTGILNRRYLNNRLSEEIARFNRFKQHFSFLMIDIDGFKQYNDSYGHMTGDTVLKTIATTLLSTLRNIDIVARFGGDEFVVILPQTPKKDAINIGKRLNESVEKAYVPTKDGSLQNGLTISIGLTSYPDDASSAAELLEKTDQALYLAKKGGRNRLVYL